MKPADHLLEFAKRKVRYAGITAHRGKERQRTVAPIVGKPLFTQIAVIDERMHRQQLDSRDAEAADVTDDRRGGQAAERAAQWFRYVGVELRVALYMGFIDNRPFPRHAGCTVVAPGEGRVDHTALDHERRAVPGVERRVVLTQNIAEQLGCPGNLTHDRAGVGIEQQFVGVEAVAIGRFVGAMHAIAIDGAGPRLRQETVPDFVGVFRQVDPAELGLTRVVEQAQFDPRCVGGEKGEVHTQAGPGRPLGIGAAFFY